MLDLFIFLFILSILIFVHEFGHFIVAKKMGVRVEEFSLGFGRKLIKRKRGDTEYSISAIPLGGYVKMAGDNLDEYKGKPDEYFSKAPGKRFWIIFCGPLLNYLLGIIFLWAIFFIGYPTFTTRVGSLVEGFGAKEAGLKVGDKITAVDGKNVYYVDELQKIIFSKKEKSSVELTVLRENKPFNVLVRIKERELEDVTGGQKRAYGHLGVGFDEIVEIKHGFIESSFLSVRKTFELTGETYKALFRLFTGRSSVRESMTGPLGIFLLTSKLIKLGIVAVLNFMAILSISLAIFNLLPLPVLDGGHIILLALERIRGKTLSLRVEEAINKVGMTLILSLVVFVTYNDIVRNFGEQIARFFIK